MSHFALVHSTLKVYLCTSLFLSDFSSESSTLLVFTSELLPSVKFYLWTSIFLSFLPQSYFCQIVPQYPLLSNRFYLRIPLDSVRFYLKTSNFLSDFTSKLLYVWFYLESTNICQILPQNPLVSVRFYLRTPTFFRILPQNLLPSVSFYLRTSFFLSDFTSESTTFCQILPQRLQSCVTFYLTIR